MPAADDNGPHAATGVRHRLAIALLVMLGAFALCAALVGTAATVGLDHRLIAWVGDNRGGLLDALGLGFARAGVWGVLGAVTLALGSLLVLARRRRDAAYLVATVAVSAGLNLLLKVAFLERLQARPGLSNVSLCRVGRIVHQLAVPAR